jgi:hypothetical protein
MNVGEFREGKRHGQGKCIFANKDIYEGEWKEDLFDGKGKYSYWNPTLTQEKQIETYEGEWREGVKHGKGLYIDADAVRNNGIW